MDKNDPNVGTGMVGAPECGDVMKLQVKVNPTTGLNEPLVKPAAQNKRPVAAGAESPA
jgi:hypothetical protein